MENDLLTLNGRYYSMSDIVLLLAKAMEMGLPLEAGSWVESMTIAQIDRLVNGSYDA
jgi:hypothetical protein